MPTIYPFSAIVGQERMRRALILNAVDPRIGGVLILGNAGQPNRLLPAPWQPYSPRCAWSRLPFWLRPRAASWCTECRERAASGEPLPVEERTIPFINLPVSATEDRVVGTLDIEQAIQKGKVTLSRACWQPPIEVVIYR